MELRVFLTMLLLIISIYCTFVHGHKSTLLSLENCKHPNPPMDKNLNKKLHTFIGTYLNKKGKRIVRGNATLLQDLPGYAIFRAGSADKKRQFKMTCKNVVTRLVLQAAGIKYDPKECKAFKGQYVFDNIDVSVIDKAVNFIPTRRTGINEWYFGLYGREGTYVCFDIRIKIEN